MADAMHDLLISNDPGDGFIIKSFVVFKLFKTKTMP